MNRDDIIRRAHEADCLDDQHYGTVWANKLERFAHLVAAAEREALRKRIERLEQRLMCRGGPDAHYCSHCDNSLWVDDIHGDAARACAVVIHARGEK